jgi:hypothetical protein
MKTGAGEDPFADAETDESADQGATDSDEPAKRTDSNGGPVSQSSSDERSIQIPYLFRRDSVQAGRSRVPLFLMPETKRAERDARRTLEERFGQDVSLTDLREGLMRAGLTHLDEVEAELEAWGYGLTFDE